MRIPCACSVRSGWRGRTHARYAQRGRSPASKVYSPTRDNQDAFAREMSQQLDVEVLPMETAEQAVRGADIVSCCTNSHRRPAFRGEWLENGTFISNMLAAEMDDAALS